MKLITVLEGQTIADISIQEFGNTEFIATICKDNDVGLNDNLAGLELIINSEGLGNQKVKDYILLNKIKPNNKCYDYVHYSYLEDGIFLEDGIILGDI